MHKLVITTQVHHMAQFLCYRENLCRSDVFLSNCHQHSRATTHPDPNQFLCSVLIQSKFTMVWFLSNFSSAITSLSICMSASLVRMFSIRAYFAVIWQHWSEIVSQQRSKHRRTPFCNLRYLWGILSVVTCLTLRRKYEPLKLRLLSNKCLI